MCSGNVVGGRIGKLHLCLMAFAEEQVVKSRVCKSMAIKIFVAIFREGRLVDKQTNICQRTK